MAPRTVTIIFKNDVESMRGDRTFVAVAKDDEAAKRWIQDEVDHKHDNGNRYASGMSVDEWLQYGTFSLSTVPVH